MRGKDDGLRPRTAVPEVPLFDLSAQHHALRRELEAAVAEALAEGTYIVGRRVVQFEAALARRCECRFAIGLNSGTDALELALRAVGVGPGDEVIVPAFTFMATALAVTTVGATPVFADIEADSYGIDVEDAARRLSRKTKAILPVHLYGQPCDVDGVLRLAKRHGLHVIEDCAQAIGATYRGRPVGSFGAIGCFSFYPTKNLGAAGDAGAVVTNRPALAERLARLRNYGTTDKITYWTYGRNSRLDELQAAVLLVKLRHLDRWNNARRRRAAWYRACLKAEGMDGIGLPRELPHRRHVYHLFVIRVEDRARVQPALAARGIQTAVYYAEPLHRQPIYERARVRSGSLPRAEQAAREVLALPLYPELRHAQVRRVMHALCAVT